MYSNTIKIFPYITSCSKWQVNTTISRFNCIIVFICFTENYFHHSRTIFSNFFTFSIITYIDIAHTAIIQSKVGFIYICNNCICIHIAFIYSIIFNAIIIAINILYGIISCSC